MIASQPFPRAIAITAGLVATSWLLLSMARMLMFPRPEQVWITNVIFRLGQAVASWLSERLTEDVHRHRVLGSFAPVALLALPLVWAVGLIVAFAGLFWGIEGGSYLDALKLSGSSLTTLGFVAAPSSLSTIVAIVEALLGLAIVALVISFLPTFYGTFSRREAAVSRLAIYAGRPSSPLEVIVRSHRVDRLRTLSTQWDSWEQWFVELEETHTTFPTLVYFRSARHDRSWLGAAETILDSAAMISALRLQPDSGPSQTMLRAGHLSLREIADFFGVPDELTGMSSDKLSVTRAQFDNFIEELHVHGVTTPVAGDRAWETFASWRAKYDQAVVGLRKEIIDAPSHWDVEDPYGRTFTDSTATDQDRSEK